MPKLSCGSGGGGAGRPLLRVATGDAASLGTLSAQLACWAAGRQRGACCPG